ncbi:hypothetical protein DOJ06_23900 [Salmonella enterica subsp. enterica serovar Bareilly]|nr:hypothetical protein [Salmonella enterica subsp. enterica serovar Bareilly]
MTTTISSTLNQGYRDALLAYYLGQYVPNSGNSTLTSLVQTPEDVYEYLLIDPLVNNDVQTSRVAQAMSSIQQYINGIALNMEPGYNTQTLDPNQLQQWNNGANQYAIWGGEVELDTYPENYVDPTLRSSQTEYFKALNTQLNQNTINTDTAQQAVLEYLNSFEQVANLEILSGYMSGNDKSSGVYYFIGKSYTSNDYYWRSFDMQQNVNNTISTSAWSEWYSLDVQFNPDALTGTIRPVYFNNRLYIFWFERTLSGKTEDTSTDTSQKLYTLSLYSSCCDFNRNWSAPSLVAQVMQETSSDKASYYPIFTTDQNCYTFCSFIPASQQGGNISVCLYIDNPNYTESSSTEPEYYTFSVSVDYLFQNPEITDSMIFPVLENYAGEQGQKRVQNDTRLTNAYPVIIEDVSSDEFMGLMLADIPELQESNITIQSDGSLSVALTLNVDTSDYLAFNGTLMNTSSYYSLENSFTGNILACWSHYAVTEYGTDSYDNDYYFDLIMSGSLYSPDISSGDTITLLDMTLTEANSADTLNFRNTDVTSPFENVLGNAWTPEQSPFDSSTEYVIYLEFESSVYTRVESTVPFSNTDCSVQVFSGTWGAGSPVASSAVDGSTTQTLTFTLPPDADNNYVITYGVTDSITGRVAWREYTVAVMPVDMDMPYIQTGSNIDGSGNACYLDFHGSTFSDGSTAINSIRLNTLFVRELINRASISIDSLLTWDTQLAPEPPMTTGDTGTTTPMDFLGANGIYFWELFFYMPWLVAHRLYQEADYQGAQQWFGYIFDPSARGRVSSDPNYPEPDYWSVRPLVESPAGQAQGAMVQATTDPDAIASAYPIHYQKAIVMAYVNNLIATADASYRLLTSDGLSLAKLQYCQAKDLLGPRPDVKLLNQWRPVTLAAVSAGEGTALSMLEMTTTENLYTFPGEGYSALAVVENPSFIEPLNTQLLGYWNLIDSRLYNLRHNLSIDGLPISVPLYAPPVNPTVLMQQSAQGGSLSSSASGLAMAIPPYRFRTMLQSAQGAVNTLSQFGQTLLSYYERGDGASLQELQQQQALDLSAFTISLQQQSIDALNADQAALQASQSLAQQRYDHYFDLYSNGVSSDEKLAMDKLLQAGQMNSIAQPFTLTASILNTAPNLFGFSMGGMILGATTEATATGYQLAANIEQTNAQRIETSEQYRRRSQEWQIQYQQAQSEVNAIGKQLDALAIRQQAAQTALQQAQAEQANLQATLRFLTSRFTQSSLYNWLTGQLSALYYQAYDAVLSLCMSTQACWQYEMGDITSTFIQTGAWNDSYHGLLVGETLTLNLQQMESAWLSRNQRRLELTRTLSLKQLLGDGFADLTTNGKVNFSLSESLFDNDYPGHYLRQIKCLTLSLPALVGPYQDVRATLTQTSSSTLLKADITGVNYLNDSTTGSASNIITNQRANQQIAVSSGLNDSGLFELNFGDERYLPFEGTGAVSNWQLAFPNYTSDEQQALLASLNDVIVQVHYTALYGGASFEQAVTQTL